MSTRFFRIAMLAVAVFVLAAPGAASARSKRPAPAAASTATTDCYGTPIIMTGIDCPKRTARATGQPAPQRAERPRLRARGSGGPYIANLPRTQPLSVPQAVGPYNPPPVANPSAVITQSNHSFPLNGGLGLNPSDRDTYLRYNLNR